MVTELHLAPTPLARENLLAEGVAQEKVVVTGNTAVDAVKMLVEMKAADLLKSLLPAANGSQSGSILNRRSRLRSVSHLELWTPGWLKNVFRSFGCQHD